VVLRGGRDAANRPAVASALWSLLDCEVIHAEKSILNLQNQDCQVNSFIYETINVEIPQKLFGINSQVGSVECWFLESCVAFPMAQPVALNTRQRNE
jgi:hypothetical protein